MSSPHLQESRGFPQFSVGRKGDVSYCEEELKGFHYLVSSHRQPCPSLKAQIRCLSPCQEFAESKF